MRPKNHIKKMREVRGMSQEDLAQRLHTFNQQISHLELGKRRLTWDWMLRIADALECHPTDLVDGPTTDANPEEYELLKHFRSLPPHERETVQKMTAFMAESKTPYRQDSKKKK